LLFGNRHRLELLVALAEAQDGGVNLSMLAAVQGVPASVYYGPLRDLIDAGLVRRLDRSVGDRRRWYSRTDHAVWECLRPLVGRLAETWVQAS